MNTTVVTALYNINREEKGDGRKWTDYLHWFKDTLQLPMPMVIFTSEDLKSFVEKHRLPHYKTQIIIADPPYAYLEPVIREIIHSPEYKQRITNNNRVECILPFYIIIQYSKFKWLQEAANRNTFQSDYFFWMDAGMSRFIDVRAPVKERVSFPADKLCIQKNHLFDRYVVNEDYIWNSQCLMCGTIFGGDSTIINRLEPIIDEMLHHWLMDLHLVNNEQIMLAYLAKRNGSLFNLVLNNTNGHICLYQRYFVQ